MNAADWNAELYDNKHSFVWKLASSVVELLDPQPGERILDIGCGTGTLTAKIAESGAAVTGLDSSPAMIEEARRVNPQVEFVRDDFADSDIKLLKVLDGGGLAVLHPNVPDGSFVGDNRSLADHSPRQSRNFTRSHAASIAWSGAGWASR